MAPKRLQTAPTPIQRNHYPAEIATSHGTVFHGDGAARNGGLVCLDGHEVWLGGVKHDLQRRVGVYGATHFP
jgi:hypothetical protein